MAKYHVGTAGWSYEDWDGIVYPVPRPAASTPSLTSPNTSTSSRSTAPFIVRRVPPWPAPGSRRSTTVPDFLFSLKLHQVFTHQRKGFTQKDVDEFKTAADIIRLPGPAGRAPLPVPLVLRQHRAHTGLPPPSLPAFSRIPAGRRGPSFRWDAPASTSCSATTGSVLQHRPARLPQLDQTLGRERPTPSSPTSACTAGITRIGSGKAPAGTPATITSTPRTSSRTGSTGSRSSARTPTRSTSLPTTTTGGRPWPTPSRSRT